MAIAVRKFKETVELGSPLLRRIRSNKYFPVALFSLLILAAAVIHVWQRVIVIDLVKEVTQLRAENRSLTDDSKKMQSQISRLSMAARIETIARDSLHLRPVTADRLYTLVTDENDRVVDDELTTMFSSLKRVAEYFPVITQSEASAQELRQLDADTIQAENAE